MLKWFKSCKTLEDVKKTYKQLAKQYHPDLNGGKTEKEMKEINNEYETAFEMLKNKHADSNKKATNNATDGYSTAETPEMFKDIIDGLIHCDGLQIDIVGSWVWVTGNTYIHREIIKKLGFKWASKKKAWYWHTDEYKARRSNLTLDEIKNKYGCQSFKANSQLRLA